MTRPVLVLGTEPRVAVTIARSLHSRGIPVDVAEIFGKQPRFRSRAIRKEISLPSFRHASNEFEMSLRRLIEAESYSMLFPCSDSALVAISPLYESLRTRLSIGCPPPHIVKRVLDKGFTLETAQRCGIPIPETYHISNHSELEELRNTLRFPLIGKPLSKRSVGAHKIRFFPHFDDLKTAFETESDLGTNTLFQEFVPGEGVGINILLHQGEPVAVFQHRRLKELPSTGGVSVLTISESPDPRLLTWALRLLRHLEWEGIAMVEFRVEQRGDMAVLMEVNGRYWGALASAVHAGLDFPWYE